MAAAKDRACQSGILMSHPPCFQAALLVPAREIAALQLTRAAAVTIPARLAHQLVKQLCAAHPLPAALKHLKRIRKAAEGGRVAAEGGSNAAAAHASAVAAHGSASSAHASAFLSELPAYSSSGSLDVAAEGDINAAAAHASAAAAAQVAETVSPGLPPSRSSGSSSLDVILCLLPEGETSAGQDVTTESRDGDIEVQIRSPFKEGMTLVSCLL